MKTAWHKWLKLSIKLMHIWANIFMFIIYYIFIVPLSFILQVFFTQALLGHGNYKKDNSYWIKKKKVVQDITWAREQ